MDTLKYALQWGPDEDTLVKLLRHGRPPIVPFIAHLANLGEYNLIKSLIRRRDLRHLVRTMQTVPFEETGELLWEMFIGTPIFSVTSHWLKYPHLPVPDS